MLEYHDPYTYIILLIRSLKPSSYFFTGTTKSRKMDFDGFQNSLLEIAFKKGQPLGQLIEQIAHAAGGGPTNNGGTVAESNRFYDDKSTYTGAAAQQFATEGRNHSASSPEATSKATYGSNSPYYRQINIDLEGESGTDEYGVLGTQMAMSEFDSSSDRN